jgi:hypothetical protein
MALHFVASRPDPALVSLPWSTPLEEWTDDYVVPLPRGLSRHIVRIVRLRERMYAIKETQEEIAFREYRLLRDLHRLGLPAVKPVGVVTGREDDADEELPCALLTEHLAFSLPYRALFSHGTNAGSGPLATMCSAISPRLDDQFQGQARCATPGIPPGCVVVDSQENHYSFAPPPCQPGARRRSLGHPLE